MTHENITGQRFGGLVAVSHVVGTKPTEWIFTCDCGATTKAIIANVKRGFTTSCGCKRRRKDLTDQRFGRLIAQKYENGKWVCVCDCGNLISVPSTSLTKNFTQSCGCLRQFTKTLMTTHGMRNTPEFNVWSNVRSRCNNPNNHSFNLYGGRGIKICQRWDDFNNFYADMGPRPGPTYSIERKDNSLDYGPDNCVWATPTEQANNRRSNRRYEYLGRLVTIRQAILESGSTVKVSTLRARLNNQGLTMEQALKP